MSCKGSRHTRPGLRLPTLPKRAQRVGPAISWTGSAVVIAAVDNEGDLDYWYQHAGTGTWHRQQVAAGSVASYDGAAIAWTGRSVILAGVSLNGSLNFWWQAAGTSSWHEEPVASLSPDADHFPPSMAPADGGLMYD
jgi:hypothetical protein